MPVEKWELEQQLLWLFWIFMIQVPSEYLLVLMHKDLLVELGWFDIIRRRLNLKDSMEQTGLAWEESLMSIEIHISWRKLHLGQIMIPYFSILLEAKK